MKQDIVHQLVLGLERPEKFRPLAQRPEGLLEALADLLLEALSPAAVDPDPQSAAATDQASTKGVGDEPEDHT